MERVLVNNDSPFTICPLEPTSLTAPDLEPSQPSPCLMELQPDSTVDMDPETVADNVPASLTELFPAPEPEPNNASDQVHDSATTPVPEGVLLEFEGIDGSPTHISATMKDLCLLCLPLLLPLPEPAKSPWHGDTLSLPPASVIIYCVIIWSLLLLAPPSLHSPMYCFVCLGLFLGLFEMHRRCADRSAYDIKVPRE
ncbi:hypothetical protein DPX16_4694 [Anabarilius grahami]|nr:hypothetical protein DPX16_4694 [Anabarilius grahami]